MAVLNSGLYYLLVLSTVLLKQRARDLFPGDERNMGHLDQMQALAAVELFVCTKIYYCIPKYFIQEGGTPTHSVLRSATSVKISQQST